MLFQQKINQHPHAAGFLAVLQIIKIHGRVGLPIALEHGNEVFLIVKLRRHRLKQAADAHALAHGIGNHVDVVGVEKFRRRAGNSRTYIVEGLEE